MEHQIDKIMKTLGPTGRARNGERVATYVQNFEDAPRDSATTRGKQRDGRHLRPEFQGRSTRKRHFEDARRASATTCEKQREGRQIRGRKVTGARWRP